MGAFADTIPPAAFLVLITALGLIFGSFVTALSYRLPRGFSIAKGRSACPACGTVLAARDLVPLFSWILNRGTCRACGARISWRYPAIEIAMAALFVSAALLVEDFTRLILVLAATPVMMTLAVIDFEHRRLPTSVLASLAVVALGFRYVSDGDLVLAGTSAAVVLAAAILLDLIGRRTLSQGLGMGDAKLMAVSALALPPADLLLALGIAGGLGVATGLLLPARATAGRTQIPFGPSILIGLWTALIAVQ